MPSEASTPESTSMDRVFNNLAKLCLVIALLLTFGIAASEIKSFDIFWQLHSGRHILQTKSFIYKDTFSLAAETARYEHCWLHDILFYAAYSIGGYKAVSVFKGIIILAIGLVVIAIARLRGSSWQSIFIIIPTFFLFSASGWSSRPQLWTYFMFVVFLWFLERFRRRPGRYVYWLGLLMIFWANLHAGSIIAFAVLCAYLTGEGLSRLSGRSEAPKGVYRHYAILIAVLLLAGLITPYGSMILKTLIAAPKAGISSGLVRHALNFDWQPTNFFMYPYYFYCLAAALVLLLAGWRRLDFTDGVLLVGLAIMGWRLGRHVPFFILASAALLPVYADTAAKQLLGRLSNQRAGFLMGVGLVFGILLFEAFFFPSRMASNGFRPGIRKTYYPIDAARFVAANRLPGNIFNTYDWGGYLIWKLYPAFRVFWDGRSTSEEMFRLGSKVMWANGQDREWEKILNRFKVNTIVKKACNVVDGRHYPLLDRLRTHPDWVLVMAGQSALVFVRKSACDPNWLQQHALPKRRIDDTILADAVRLLKTDPKRFMAYREIATIYVKRKQFRNALIPLKRYIETLPGRDHKAEEYYEKLKKIVARNAVKKKKGKTE